MVSYDTVGLSNDKGLQYYNLIRASRPNRLESVKHNGGLECQSAINTLCACS